MDVPARSEITVLLRQWHAGDREALEKVIPLVYRQLHATAQRYMLQERPGHVLQSTALVNETFLRLVEMQQIEWQDRQHFYGVCARIMRHVLIDYARSRLSRKRGGDEQQVPLEDVEKGLIGDLSEQLITLDAALSELATFDERMSQVVQYRLFAGATVEETAAALHISERTVKREWQAAQVWLAAELERRK